MNKDARRYTFKLAALLMALSVLFVLPAYAEYAYSTVDFPGVDYAAGGYTQLSGINNAGIAVVIAQISGTSPTIPFRYDIRRHLFTLLPDYSSSATSYTLANGINDAGTVVGGESQDNGATEFAFVLKHGEFELLSRPGSSTFTEARAINVHGIVSGYALNDADGTYSGFIYNPVSKVWTDVLPSTVTIAQGLNDRDELVGNVFEDAGVVCPACQPGPFGFIRAPNTGAVSIFTINGNNTSARGISDFGTITGFFFDENFVANGFVIAAPKHAAFQTITVSPKDFVNFPKASGTFPEGIANDGTVAGMWADASGAFHGFVAEPRSK